MADVPLNLLLNDGLVKQVFEEIANNRSVIHKDLHDSLIRRDAQPSPEAVTSAVEVLKKADLVKEVVAPINDFNTYYVTEDGLNTERALSTGAPVSKRPVDIGSKSLDDFT